MASSGDARPPSRSPRSGRRRLAVFAGAATLLAALLSPFAQSDDDRRAEREAMVAEQIAGRDVRDPRVLDALRRVPRHRFVPLPWRLAAYADQPLPIGEEQTISQPYVVAKMTEVLRLKPSDRVFELGTGSGYQAAVASRLCAHVFTVEIHASLAERAREVLHDLGYENVSVRSGDGFRGWPEKAPFDAMIVTAAVPSLPQELLKQLRPGGHAVMPVGEAGGVQDLVLLEKRADGSVATTQIFPVRFVPATGQP
jgi:protein-L-isoaspartate(D-aspartate) O-methyltransferase